MVVMCAKSCSRCGRPKNTGDVFYVARVTLTADVEEELAELPGEDIRGAMRKQIESANSKSEQELMDEVYQEIYFYLCKSCRDWFTGGPLKKMRSQGEGNG
jgi:hypothetical protein